MRSQRVTRRAVLCAIVIALTASTASALPRRSPPLAGTTTRVSTRADGSQAVGDVAGQGEVTEPSISANGRFVVFYTTLQLGLGSCGAGTYLRDLVTGRLEMISVPARGCAPEPGVAGSSHSYTSISADGRYVAFTSAALDLLAGRPLPERSPSGNMTLQVFLRDRLRKKTVLVSVGYDGRPANGTTARPTVSDDGRFVAFESPATNIVRGDRGDPEETLRTEVWLRDVQRGTTMRVGPDIRRAGRGPKLFPSLSGNGRYVAFDALDGTLVANRGTGGDGVVFSETPRNQVYVWDRLTRRVDLVSRSDAGYAADGLSTLGAYVGSKISRDGRWIVYRSNARNVTGPNGTGLYDADQVFLFDRVAKRVRRVTDGLVGEGGNGESDYPCLSADGRFVSFASASSNLGDVDVTPGYYEGLPDVGTDIFVYDRDSKITRLVSRSTEGVPADANSRESCPSDGGNVVVFISRATTLVDDDTNALPDLFVRRYPA